MKIFLPAPVLLVLLASPVFSLTSRDAYVIRKGDTWTLGTSRVERTLALADGKFVTRTWRDKASGRELLVAGMVSDELVAVIDGQKVLGTSGGGKLLDAKERTLARGEIQLDVVLKRDSLEVTKSYVVYPGSSIIREWVSFKNAGTGPLRVSEPGSHFRNPRPARIAPAPISWRTASSSKRWSPVS